MVALLVSAAMLSQFTHEVAPPSVAQVLTDPRYLSSKRTGTSGLSSSRPPRYLSLARAHSRTLALVRFLADEGGTLRSEST
jgi:hypothetical protein